MNALIAASFPDFTPILIRLVVILIVCGILAFLLSKAPFIADPWKSVINWVLIAIPVVYVVIVLIGLL